ncbi:winged helix-turn-helix transcriptional regulator [Candidatus Woesearchaeota archaeon]|nr:winged helix-turn-helix transcriptional regulator [Candidatus Woesearchaeota archaeon]
MQATLKALSEPNRLRIVDVLIDGPHSVGEIVIELEISQPLVSKHLSILSEAGLVEVHQVAQKRIYTLRAKPFKEMDSWLVSYRRLWGEKFNRLDKLLEEEKNKLEGGTKK